MRDATSLRWPQHLGSTWWPAKLTHLNKGLQRHSPPTTRRCWPITRGGMPSSAPDRPRPMQAAVPGQPCREITLGLRIRQENRPMKTSTRNSRILSCSPQLMPSPSMAHVNAACRKDFVNFVRKFFHVLNPSTTFHMNWHICAIAYVLEQVRLGKIKRVMITVPPRSLKSLMCSVSFPAFVLGHDPTRRLIVASYSADLAIKHGNDFRTVVNSAEYHAIFPGMLSLGAEKHSGRGRHDLERIPARHLG